jgi:hypothetical protein
MESAPLLDSAGRRRSPATLSGYHLGEAWNECGSSGWIDELRAAPVQVWSAVHEARLLGSSSQSHALAAHSASPSRMYFVALTER